MLGSIITQDVHRVPTGSTFFKSTGKDFRHTVMCFNSHSTDILVQSNEDFSCNRNLMADDYFSSKPESTEGLDRTLILVLLACVPLIQRRASHSPVVSIVSDALAVSPPSHSFVCSTSPQFVLFRLFFILLQLVLTLLLVMFIFSLEGFGLFPPPIVFSFLLFNLQKRGPD